MLIKIKKCSDNLLWYSRYIGKHFEVVTVDEPEQMYIVRDNNHDENIVLFKDAERMQW